MFINSNSGTEKNRRICKAKITTAREPIPRKSAYSGMPTALADQLIQKLFKCPASIKARDPIIDENQYSKGRRAD